MDRIAVFLDEEEVATTYTPANPCADHLPEEGLSIENSSFVWNGDATADVAEPSVSSSSSAVHSEGTLPAEDCQFQLRDITVAFPEGELTCVTGATASGKTALVVRGFITGINHNLPPVDGSSRGNAHLVYGKNTYTQSPI